MTKSLGWGHCHCCGQSVDFRGYCTNDLCWYTTHFQHEVNNMENQVVAVLKTIDKGDHIEGTWEVMGFKDLRKGDIYRVLKRKDEGMFEPALLTDDGRQQVFVATVDADPVEGTFATKALRVRGF